MRIGEIECLGEQLQWTATMSTALVVEPAEISQNRLCRDFGKRLDSPIPAPGDEFIENKAAPGDGSRLSVVHAELREVAGTQGRWYRSTRHRLNLSKKRALVMPM